MSALDQKLESLKHCIKTEADEDAQEHLFDLLRALSLRNTDHKDLTTDGINLRGLLEET